MEARELIGKSIRGFKFESRGFLPFTPTMYDYIGRVGKIINVDEKAGDVFVDFSSSDVWVYPLDQALEHLVDNTQPSALDKFFYFLEQNQYFIDDKLVAEYKRLKDVH